MNERFIYVLILPVVAVMLAILGRRIYWMFDHGKWKEWNNPDINAEIKLPISTEPLKLMKSEYKLLTKISFTDGYCYMTTKSKTDYSRTNIPSITRVTMSVDDEMLSNIFKKAYAAHDKAVKRSKTYKKA